MVQAKKKIFEYGKNLSEKHPNLRPYLRYARKILFSKNIPEVPRFSGWGMTTRHELPWIDDYHGEIFRKTSEDIKKQFKFTTKDVGINSENIDILLWRHWNVSTAVRYSMTFANTDDYNFVECGVGEGISSFFALREISVHSEIANSFSMHLYDSWEGMRREDLMERELHQIGRYQELNLEIVKKNLSEFNSHVVYHQGFIPNSFTIPPDSPNSISYLHIDLNSAIPTLQTLKFFYPKLVNGGVILFDDYGWGGYPDTKKIIDEFFHNKPGIIIKSPTGQAMYIHK